MEEDYMKLCIWLNSLDAKPEFLAVNARSNLRQLLLDMFDKSPQHLIGVFRMYLKTHQFENKECEYFTCRDVQTSLYE